MNKTYMIGGRKIQMDQVERIYNTNGKTFGWNIAAKHIPEVLASMEARNVIWATPYKAVAKLGGYEYDLFLKQS